MDEIDELKRRVKEMTAEAANNETILKKTQARELSLLRADSLAQLLHAMERFARVIFARRHKRRAARSAARDSPLAPRERRAPRRVQAGLLRRFAGGSRTAAHRLAQTVAGPLRRRRSPSVVSGKLQLEERGSVAAASQGSRYGSAVPRQPGSQAVHPAPRDRLSCASGGGCRRVPGECRESRAASASRNNRLPDRLAQPPLPATTPEGRTGARP